MWRTIDKRKRETRTRWKLREGRTNNEEQKRDKKREAEEGAERFGRMIEEGRGKRRKRRKKRREVDRRFKEQERGNMRE